MNIWVGVLTVRLECRTVGWIYEYLGGCIDSQGGV